MSKSFKIVSLLLYLLLFIYLFSYKFLDNQLIQTEYFIFISILYCLKNSFKSFFKDLKVFLPFISSMLLIYLLFGLFGFKGFGDYNPQSSTIIYWTLFGVRRIFLFLSTALTFGTAFSFISIDDITSLPIDIKYLKFIILGKSLFENANNSFERFDFFIQMFPEFQKEEKQGLKKKFKKNLLIILGLIFFIIRESNIQGELIDNRIKHCFKNNKS